MKPCPDCHAEMRDDALFCGNCGARVVATTNNQTLFGMAAVDLNEFPELESGYKKGKQSTSRASALSTPLTAAAIDRGHRRNTPPVNGAFKEDALDFSVPNFSAEASEVEEIARAPEIDTTHHTQIWGAISRFDDSNVPEHTLPEPAESDTTDPPNILDVDIHASQHAEFSNPRFPTPLSEDAIETEEIPRNFHSLEKEVVRRNAITGLSLSNVGGPRSRQTRYKLVLLLTTLCIFFVFTIFAVIIAYLLYYR